MHNWLHPSLTREVRSKSQSNLKQQVLTCNTSWLSYHSRWKVSKVSSPPRYNRSRSGSSRLSASKTSTSRQLKNSRKISPNSKQRFKRKTDRCTANFRVRSKAFPMRSWASVKSQSLWRRKLWKQSQPQSKCMISVQLLSMSKTLCTSSTPKKTSLGSST